MASLRRRLTVSASLTLVLTLGLTAAVLDGAFRETSRALVEERLQAQLYAVLAATEKNPAGQLTVVETPPDPRFATPGSGLYAQLQASEGEVLWRSPSMLAMDIKFPSGAAPGKTEFAPATGHDGEPLFGVAFSASWELDGGQHSRFVVQIAEHRAPFEARLAAFRQRLVLWFTSAGLLTIIVQILVLRWGLGPLARAATQIAEIRDGRRQRLDGEHTEELRPLTDSINRLIDANDQRLSRYPRRAR